MDIKTSRRFAGKLYALYTTGTEAKCNRVGASRKAALGALYKIVRTPAWHEDRYAIYIYRK